MLTDLIVENLGVIETALLTLEKGCTVVTGETGAGKTLIVTALELLGGGRADPSAIRAGSREARIEGRFVLGTDHPVVKILEDNGIVDGQEITSRTDLELVITRTISSTAGRARINGRLVTIGLLGDVGGALLDVVGQHSHQRLFAPAFQRAALDGFAGSEAVTRAQEVADAVRRVQRAVGTLDELQVMQQAQARELDVLRYEIAEIEGAHLELGERERLLQSATRLEHAEAIAASAAEAIQALSGEGGAEERLLQAASALERGSAQDPGLRSLSERAASIVTEVSDIGFELRANAVEPDPAALEDTRRRLEVIARLCRKFGRDEGEVLGYLDRSRARSDELTALPERVSEAKEELQGMIERANALATRLSELRKSAAPRLQQAVETVLAELALGGSKVEVRLDECELYEGGAETVQLVVEMSGVGEPRPLKKVASGGELSRMALALHLVAVNQAAGTMVFDEVDAGVGGEAARAVGRCLARLSGSTGGQVLVVTHLPQVAAYADNHYRVSRGQPPAAAGATVARVEGEERVAELSRMLAGLPKSDRAHEHARELLELAAEAS